MEAKLFGTEIRKIVLGELSKERIKWKIKKKSREMKREKSKRERIKYVWKNLLTFTKKKNESIIME